MPVSDLRDEWVTETCRWKARVDAAQHALRGQSHRQRAEQVRRIVGRITCHFDYKQHGQQTRSHLASLDIEAVEGDKRSFTNTSSPAPN